jgi:hypothetical protein
MAATIIEIQARGFDDVGTRVDSLKHRLDSVKTSAQKASTDGIEKLTANGGAMGILNDLTGGLAMQFKDAYESIQLTNTGLKGMKAALLATGIGAIVVAIGLVASNWDSILKTIRSSNKELEAMASIAADNRDITKAQYDILTKSDNILKQQGFTEDEILKKKKEALKLDMAALQVQIETNKQQLDALLKEQALNMARQNSGNWFEIAKSFLFDQTEAIQTNIEKTKEQSDELLNLQNIYAGLELQLEHNEQNRVKRVEAQKEDRKFEEEEVEDEELSLEIPPDVQAKMDAHKLEIDNRKQSELEYDEWYDNLMNDQAEDEEKRRQDKTKADADALHQREQITAASFAIASTLNDLFFTKQGKQSKEGFRIAKALALSEAGLNTYKAASAAFATASASPLTLVNPSYPFVQAGIAVAFGAAQIAKIASQTFSGGSAGGGSVSSPSGGGSGAPQGQAPQAALDFSFLQNQQPIQTYVIGSDVKTANEAQQKIKDQSTL